MIGSLALRLLAAAVFLQLALLGRGEGQLGKYLVQDTLILIS